MYLSALLKGKALEVYSRLPVKDAQDYEILKDALQKRLNLAEEGFKQKTAYEISACLVGSEMCIRDSPIILCIFHR